MKWENILVHSKLINPNSNDHYEFAFRKSDGIVVKPNLGIDHHYKDAQECKYDSILRYAATYHWPLLSKTVFRIIDSKCASEQKSSRFKMGQKWNQKVGREQQSQAGTMSSTIQGGGLQTKQE